jgi:tetratricopeptide (TPR) repeat protein
VKQVCFVLMPFGKRPIRRTPEADPIEIDFDAVYRQIIQPAVETADLECHREDETQMGGIIHKSMFEYLALADYAVADLTSGNPNVFYELGIRHAVRPHGTVPLFADKQLPFDVAPLRAVKYGISEKGELTSVAEAKAALTDRLRAGRDGHTDSPIFQLLQDFKDIQHLKTDVFRERARYSEEMKARLAEAAKAGAVQLWQLERDLKDLATAEPGAVIDLFLSYRDAKAWDHMIRLVEGPMPGFLRNTTMVQEQYGLALNRAGRPDRAIQVLEALIEREGPSSETCGILGRVWKDKWEGAQKAEDPFLARGYLKKAIDAYSRGFEADSRDAYPGINAVTLMEMADPVPAEQAELLPVVRYAVKQKMAKRATANRTPDYWDYATLLELAVLASDQEAATDALASARANFRAKWELETTARNIGLIRGVRDKRGALQDWVRAIEENLRTAAS